MKEYKLRNLDCADCAVKIEEHLRKTIGVRSVSVNFATAKISIDADAEFDALRREIKRIEPEVEMVESASVVNADKEQFEAKREIVIIIGAIVFFVLGLLFKKRLAVTPYSYAEYLVFLIPYILSGRNVLISAGRNIIHGKFFDENFLMTVATLGAIFIHELPEAVAVMLFFEIGEFFQDMSVDHSRRSIKALLEIRPDYAYILSNGEIKKVLPDSVKVGDTIIVRAGEKVPLDGEIIDGVSQVDTSALTGESVPRKVAAGSDVLAGMINKTGVLTVKVTKPFSESSISKILDLVENASSKKSTTEKFITKFARYYTPVVVFSALLIAVIPPLVISGAAFGTWIYRALILLVISCPCAFVISIPLGYFGGVGGAARKGILVKGSNYLDSLAHVKTAVFDKTGTLTKGVFKVTRIVPGKGFSKKELLAYAAAAEVHSTHPIAQSILEAYNERIDSEAIGEYEEIPGYGIKARINERVILAGNDRLLHLKNIKHDVCGVAGTVIHVAVDGSYAGYIVISDELKNDAALAVSQLRKVGLEKIVMLTGDSAAVAERVAKDLALDEYYAELLPEDKVEVLEKLIKEKDAGATVAFVGDGINDAPAIARADVGIAMGGLGSDAAIETADVVIMTDAPYKVADSIKAGIKTRAIVWQNITLAFIIKGLFIILGAAGAATIWEAVFADVGVALIAIFNALRVLRQ